MKQTRPIPLPLQPIQGLIEAAQRGGEMKYITPEVFSQIQELVRTQDAQGRSKIEKDALAMLCAGVTNQYRAKEEKQQRRKQRGKLLRWHKRGAA